MNVFTRMQIVLKDNTAFDGISSATAFNDVYLGTGTNNPMVYFDYGPVWSLVNTSKSCRAIKIEPIGSSFNAIISDTVGILSTTMIGTYV